MTDRKTAFIELRDKVKAREALFGDFLLLDEIFGSLDERGVDANRAYHGSLDAAKALHEAVLPGWWWTVGTCQVSDDASVSPEGEASVTPDGREWSEITDIDQRPSGNPARAWLLSILEALIAQEEIDND